MVGSGHTKKRKNIWITSLAVVNLESRCREDRVVDRLLNGGNVVLVGYNDEDEDGEEGKLYEVNLSQVIEGIENSKKDGSWREDIQSGYGDISDAEIFMQYIMLEEIVY